MTGYFDALLRSTGVSAVAPERAMTHAAPGVVELDQETRAETTSPRAAQTADRMKVPATHERAREFEPSPVAPTARVEPITPVAPTPHATRVQRVSPPPPVEPTSARASTAAADEAPTDIGPAMVRAAMRWVAADAAAQQIGAPVAETQTHHREVLTDREVDVTSGVQKVEDALPFHRVSHTENPAPLASPAPTTRPVNTTLAMIPAAPLSPAPVARNEIVEVSIGAIHVRVDAPAVQTVGPQAPAPAPPRATAARPQRSALSRRALRRI